MTRAQPPLRREVIVAADPATAHRLWVEQIGAWWPVASHGVFGAAATVAFEGGEIVETSASGERAVWGTVTVSEPPGRLAFTWHPGRSPDAATLVELAFEDVGDGRTRVTLTHTGWEAYDDPAAARQDYADGWPLVLGALASHA